MSEDLEYLFELSIPLSAYIEDFYPDNLYNARFRTIIGRGLSELSLQAYNYYNKGHPYEPSVIQNLRLIVNKLADMIQKIQNVKGEAVLKNFLEDTLTQLTEVLNGLTKKYTNPEPSQYEKQYQERKTKGSYYYPEKKYPQKKRVEYTKTGLSVEETTRDQILQVLEGEPGTYPNNSIMKPELWNYTLEKLREKYLEYKKKNEAISLSTDDDTKKKTLIELIREKGKFPVKKED
jgi:hypothetical protein